MPELRRDPFTGDWVVIAPGRAARPRDHSGNRAECPFCPGNDAATPREVWRRSGPDGSWAVRVVPNRYPLLNPGSRFEPHLDGPYAAAQGWGHHEVVIESPAHDWDLADGDDQAVTAVLHAYRARSQALRIHRPGLVLPFRNHGAAAGTSLSHPHSQIVATPVVPLRQRRMFDVARSYYYDHGSCLYIDLAQAEIADGSRVLALTDRMLAFVPYAAAAPYEIWLMPRHHQASFADADDQMLDDAGALLHQLLADLRTLLGDAAYNYILLSAPNGEEHADYFVWHLRILPRLAATAGFELGTGMAVCQITPEQAAAQLRDVLRER